MFSSEQVIQGMDPNSAHSMQQRKEIARLNGTSSAQSLERDAIQIPHGTPFSASVKLLCVCSYPVKNRAKIGLI